MVKARTSEGARTRRIKIIKNPEMSDISSGGSIKGTRTTVNGTSKKRTTRLIRPNEKSPQSLYPYRELIIAELLKTPNIARTANKFRISRTTLTRWMQTEEFMAEYDAARRQVLELSISTVANHVNAAVETLGRNLHCGKPGDEVRAAAVILQWAGRFVPWADKEAAAAKIAMATPDQTAGATIIVVDGGEDEYIEGLKAVTPP